MKCPVDASTLVIAERSEIEIDYCPTCRGVWLDRGELDKLIERNERARGEEYQTRYPGRPVPSYDDDEDYRRYSNVPHKKKRSFLGDVFDVFD